MTGSKISGFGLDSVQIKVQIFSIKTLTPGPNLSSFPSPARPSNPPQPSWPSHAQYCRHELSAKMQAMSLAGHASSPLCFSLSRHELSARAAWPGLAESSNVASIGFFPPSCLLVLHALTLVRRGCVRGR